MYVKTHVKKHEFQALTGIKAIVTVIVINVMKSVFKILMRKLSGASTSNDNFLYTPYVHNIIIPFALFIKDTYFTLNDIHVLTYKYNIVLIVTHS